MVDIEGKNFTFSYVSEYVNVYCYCTNLLH